MKKTIRILIFIFLVIVMLAPRVAELTKFTAADEPFWLVVGANYYYALTHGEFENTVYEYHPAVTTMWIGTAAMLIYFPEYRGLMKGYFQQEKTSFDTYLVAHGKNPLVLLWWARLIQLLVNVFLLIVAFFLLRFLLDEWVALAALLLTSFAPYLFGQSRMLNHESMVGLFSLIAILAMTAYLFRTPKVGLLILSAGSAALANLTKSSAIVLLPVIAVIIFVWAISQWRGQKKTASLLLSSFKIFLLWLGILVLVYFVVWPGMWVAPGKMLYEVYGNAFSYAFQGARLSVVQEVQPSHFSLISTGSAVFDFLVSIAWRTTPITWLGLVFAVIFLFSKNRELIPLLAKYLTAFLFLEAFACIGMFALVHGRDQPHYVLSAYYGFEFAAALGWAYALRWLARKFTWAGKPLTQIVLFAAVLIAQASGLFYTAPYYYTYLNPILLAVHKAPAFFYGERMEAAAAYLAEKPNAENLTALVYFGRSFSYYFPGQTLLFKPILFDDKPQLIGDLRQADYLVIYAGMHARLPLLDEITPEHVIYLNGRPYVEIYRVSDIPSSFYSE
jgi:4-amino-4-deoxy-L-arabinose transferase-like glycosyltransferase